MPVTASRRRDLSLLIFFSEKRDSALFRYPWLIKLSPLRVLRSLFTSMTWRHPLPIRLASYMFCMNKAKRPGFRKRSPTGAVHSTKNWIISFPSTLLMNRFTSLANLAISSHDDFGKFMKNDECTWVGCLYLLCFALVLLTTYRLLKIRATSSNDMSSFPNKYWQVAGLCQSKSDTIPWA